jgi:SAM-dependent methyltransferase
MSVGMDGYESAARPYKARLFRTLFDSLSLLPDYDDDDDDGHRRRPVSIVEVGVGAFPNAPYYAAAVSSGGGGLGATARSMGLDIIGVDPNDYMFDYARDSAVRAELSTATTSSDADTHGGHSKVSLRTVHGVAESLPFATGSIDAVVATLMLCSVVDQRRALSEIRRVLRPRTGRYLFWEHVLSEDDPGLALAQRSLSPLQTIVADGCHLDRRTGDSIRNASFRGGVEMEYAMLSLEGPGNSIIGPTVFGIATA